MIRLANNKRKFDDPVSAVGFNPHTRNSIKKQNFFQRVIFFPKKNASSGGMF